MVPVISVSELVIPTAAAYVRRLLADWLVQGRWFVRRGEVARELSMVARYLAAAVDVPTVVWEKAMREALADLVARSPGVGRVVGAVVLVPAAGSGGRDELISLLREEASEQGLVGILMVEREYVRNGQPEQLPVGLTGYSRAMLLQLRVVLAEQQRFLR